MSANATSQPSWFLRRFPWAEDPRAWRRRIAELILFVAALLLLLLVRDVGTITRFALWILVIGTGLFAAEGWVGTFGPVLFYDMLRSARRARFVWLRAVYGGLLLFLLFVSFLGSRYHVDMSAAQAESQLARNFFETFSIVQFLVLSVLTPAYVAGAIAEEKDRKTLEFLLATDLRNREIVLSKLGSRLANLVLFLLVGLPLVSMLQFLGGVAPVLVQGSFAATGLTVLGLAGVSILASTYFKKPRDAVAVAYLIIVAYIAVSLLGFALLQTRHAILNVPLWFGDAFTVRDFINAFNSGNIGLYFKDIYEAAAKGELDEVVPELLGSYAMFHVPLAIICTVWAVWRMRAVALAQMYGKEVKRSLSARVLGRPPVGRFPILWKEVFAEGGIRFNWMTWIIVLVLMAATFVPFALLLIYQLDRPYSMRLNFWSGISYQMNMWVRTVTMIVGSLTLLAVAVRAATSYSSERDRHTLDSLLTTPLDSTPILLGKWVGSILTVRLAWLWLALTWAFALAVGGLHPLAIPLMMLTWGVYAAFLATLGLWFSVLSKTSLRATVWTLLTGAAVGFGHWLPWMCCIALPRLAGDVEYLAKVQAGLTPPAVLFVMPFSGDEFSRGGGRDMIEMVGFGLFGVFAYGVATVLLWSGLTLRFRAITGREGFQRPERGWAPRRPRPVQVDRDGELPRVVVEPPRVAPSPPPARRDPPPSKPHGARLVDETWDEPPKK